MSTHKLLIAEDEPDYRNLEKTYLEIQGYEVRTVASAEEALRLLEVEDFDAVVTDYNMPPGDNRAVLSTKIRARFPDLPIIMATSATEEAEVDPDLKVDYLVNKGDLFDQHKMHRVHENIRSLIERRAA